MTVVLSALAAIAATICHYRRGASCCMINSGNRKTCQKFAHTELASRVISTFLTHYRGNRIDQYRGSGRSSQQIVSAPRDSVFVCPNLSSRAYYHKLADTLGRRDLMIKSPSIFENHGRWFAGRRISGLVLDHACYVWDYADLDVAIRSDVQPIMSPDMWEVYYREIARLQSLSERRGK